MMVLRIKCAHHVHEYKRGAVIAMMCSGADFKNRAC